MADIKIVRLKMAAGTIVRVSEDEAKRLGRGFAPVGKRAAQRSETPGKSWKVDELKAYAEENDIYLDGATKKDEILAVITGDEDDSRDED